MNQHNVRVENNCLIRIISNKKIEFIMVNGEKLVEYMSIRV